jgi:two-component system CheB/CheR fusion protein
LQLQQELAASREYLQSIIQELEATNEEMQSANEEILSSNEEMQSTNEELDTAKEELQSTNEELNTLNEELHGRNEELSRVNSDLINLLGSVQIAIVIISGNLQIRRFTPMAEKVLNLIPTDVGRPIGHIQPNINCPELETLITEVIETVSIREREVQDRQGRRYLLRIRPYKNLENRIDGAVLALFETEAAHAPPAPPLGQTDQAALLAALSRPLVVLDADLRVKTVNRAFCERFGITAAQAEHRPLAELGDGEWEIPAMRAELEKIIAQGSRLENFEVVQDIPGLEPKRLWLTAGGIDPTGDGAGLILLMIDDVTSNGP